jgi:hypothetical protein
VGKGKWAVYKKTHGPDHLLPDDWNPEQKKEIASEKNKRKSELLPEGAKIIVPQDERQLSNPKKQKVIDQRNAQKVKRDADRFGTDNVTVAEDCDGAVKKDVKLAPKVIRDLCI